MSMGASCTITNNTGAVLVVTQISQVNDDATWSAPPVGTKIANGQSVQISMGNASAFPFVRGVGFNLGFIDLSSGILGGIYLDIPAVGAHHFSYANQQTFNYPTTNPSGNTYNVGISLK